MMILRQALLVALFVGCAGAVWSAPAPLAAPQIKRLEGGIAKVTEQISGTEASLRALETKVGALQETVTRLDIQRESESRNIQLSLDGANKSLDYANKIIGVLAIVAAIFTALFQWWSSRDRRKAIKEAADEVADKLTAPEILRSVFNSQEFQDAYKKATEQRENAIKSENEAAASVAGSVITEQNVENASGK